MLHAWHGSHSQFETFSYDSIGTGEGDSLGYGFYFSENRKGGEYFAEYMNFRNGTGFLYAVLLHCSERELLNLDMSLEQHSQLVKNKVQSIFGAQQKGEILLSAYSLLKQTQGVKEATQLLMRVGIKAIKSNEGTKPGHGDTFLVLDNKIIEVQDVYKWDHYSWNKI